MRSHFLCGLIRAETCREYRSYLIKTLSIVAKQKVLLFTVNIWVDSKGFWQWCIPLSNTAFLNFVHYVRSPGDSENLSCLFKSNQNTPLLHAFYSSFRTYILCIFSISFAGQSLKYEYMLYVCSTYKCDRKNIHRLNSEDKMLPYSLENRTCKHTHTYTHTNTFKNLTVRILMG
jgi:hypothetical protein